jgi:hypothetical protein
MKPLFILLLVMLSTSVDAQLLIDKDKSGIRLFGVEVTVSSKGQKQEEKVETEQESGKGLLVRNSDGKVRGVRIAGRAVEFNRSKNKKKKKKSDKSS